MCGGDARPPLSSARGGGRQEGRPGRMNGEGTEGSGLAHSTDGCTE